MTSPIRASAILRGDGILQTIGPIRGNPNVAGLYYIVLGLCKGNARAARVFIIRLCRTYTDILIYTPLWAR